MSGLGSSSRTARYRRIAVSCLRTADRSGNVGADAQLMVGPGFTGRMPFAVAERAILGPAGRLRRPHLRLGRHSQLTIRVPSGPTQVADAVPRLSGNRPARHRLACVQRSAGHRARLESGTVVPPVGSLVDALGSDGEPERGSARPGLGRKARPGQ